MSDVDNSQDIIDSRDVIARIEELQSDRDSIRDALQEAYDDFEDNTGEDHGQVSMETVESDAKITALHNVIQSIEKELAEWETEFETELAILEAFASEAEGYAPDWRYGEMLIRDSYFEEYARELAEDCV